MYEEPYDVRINNVRYRIEFDSEGIEVNGKKVVIREGSSFDNINAKGTLEELIAVCLALNKKEIPYNPA